MVWASIVFGILSAFSWLASAWITPTNIRQTWEGPCKEDLILIKRGSWLNALGATFAALAMLCQAYSTWSTNLH